MRVALAFLAFTLATSVQAQSVAGYGAGQVLTAAALNSSFASKVDYSGTPVVSLTTADHVPVQPGGTGPTLYASLGSIAAFVEATLFPGGGIPVFGPTAVGSASANPPVQIGGQSNTSGTGTIYPWVVNSSGQGSVLEANSASILAATNAAIPAGGNNIGYMPPSVGAGSFATGQVTCGTSATVIVSARTGAPGTGRVLLSIINGAVNAIYVGAAGVTTSTGAILATSGVDNENSTAAWDCVASTGTLISYIERW